MHPITGVVPEPSLIQVLSRAARIVADSEEPQASLEIALAAISGELSGIATVERADRNVTVIWLDGVADADRDAFAAAVASMAALAYQSSGRSNDTVLDAGAFLVTLDRIAAAARWRGARMAVSVFEVEGMVLGPGTDESTLVGTVGRAAHSCVRGDDVVGHLGAAQFAVLFPRAGTFEARSAFRRVRDAVMQIELGDGLICGAAGFAELDPGGTGATMLAEARERLNAARTKNAYVSPGGGSPITPMAG